MGSGLFLKSVGIICSSGLCEPDNDFRLFLAARLNKQRNTAPGHRPGFSVFDDAVIRNETFWKGRGMVVIW
jgi:hypothetical protein